jgi:hypothetical protein
VGQHIVGFDHMLVDLRSLVELVLLHNQMLVVVGIQHWHHILAVVELLHILLELHNLELLVLVVEHCRIQLGPTH